MIDGVLQGTTTAKINNVDSNHEIVFVYRSSKESIPMQKVSGQVTSNKTGKVIAGAKVIFKNNDNVYEATISLDSNASTRYSWYVDYDHNVIKLVSNNCAFSHELPGTPGIATFTFEAVAEGNCNRTFNYYRSLEGINSDTKTVCDVAVESTAVEK